MHGVGLLVGILAQRVPHADARDLVDKIGTSVRAMEGLFNSLLDISKLESGVIKPDAQEFEIGEPLRAVESTYLPQVKDKGIELRCVRSTALVKSDPAMLERIVSNLVANTIRYTPRGRVLMGCRRRRDALVLQAWDTGIGIPEGLLDHIFEEFFQLANPERDRDKGLGLGLSIVKRSADLLGHAVAVRSREGAGSMFAVTVPAAIRGEARRIDRVEMRSAGTLLGAFVVIVDDDDKNRFAMC
jgi:signal transduction histidine kinase